MRISDWSSDVWSSDLGVRATGRALRNTYIPVIMKLSLCTPVKGRPREFDVGDALAAALRVFWSKGYEGASLTDLTEAMGITRPSLYAAFGNKEALFRKALDLYEEEKIAYVQTGRASCRERGCQDG